MCAHDSYTHLRDLTGLQTVPVFSLLGNLDQAAADSKPRWAFQCRLVSSQMLPEAEHIPGTCGDFSCVPPPD